MNTEIRFLQQLEVDLHDAALRERRRAAGSPSTDPRRLPRRGPRWGAVAAAFMALLVVAGGIGFLAQGGNSSNSTGGFEAPAKVDAGGASGTAVPAPTADRPGIATDQWGNTSFGTVGNASDLGQTVDAGQGPAGKDVSVPSGDLSKIIRDGRIGLELANGTFTRNVAAVTRIARSQGGIVLSSSTENDTAGTFTLRIPAKHFDEAMLRLRALGAADGAQVLYQDSAGKDVTADFVDLAARLHILQGTKARFVALQAKATTTGAILALGARLDQVQLQIEQIQGQLNVINDQVAESTVKVELREKDAPEANTTDPVTRPSLGSAWQHSVQGFLRVVGAVIVGLGYLIPIGLIALAIWGVVMLARRKRRAAS